MAEKLLSGQQFTLEDFLDQLITVRKMGPISNMLGMLPGMGQMKDQLAQLDDTHFDRVTAIIRSMTPLERTNPKVINGSRRARSRAVPGSPSWTSTSCSTASRTRRR
jgi:signal recognition particle subunit SRP54